MNRPESDLQIQVVDLLRLYEKSRGFLFFSVPNEALGKAKTGGGIARIVRLKAMGMRAGVADIVIVRNGRAYFLELKSAKGKQSDAQELFQLDAFDAGAEYAMARTLEEVVDALKLWGIIP